MDTATVRIRLEEMRGELDRSIVVLQGERPADRDALDSPQDQVDAGTSISESDRAQAILAGLKQQRLRVSEALLRIERGSYGTCLDCGTPIPDGRLDARPEADRCVSCQGRRDRVRR